MDVSLWPLNSTDVGSGHGHRNFPAPVAFYVGTKRILYLSIMEGMFSRVYLKRKIYHIPDTKCLININSMNPQKTL